MQIRRKDEAPVKERSQVRSHVLLDAGELGSRHLCVTWNEVPPGGRQRPHLHSECEQAYVIVSGEGRISVAGVEETVSPGDLIFIPPSSEHGLINDGDELLLYITTTSPQVSIDELHGTQLASEVDEFLDK